MFDRRRLTRLGTIAATLCALGPAVEAESIRDLPDPTRPAIVESAVAEEVAPETTPLELSAVFFARDRRVAIINGVRARNGDSIGNARVVEILPDLVRMERDGKLIDLRLIPKDIKDVREGSP